MCFTITEQSYAHCLLLQEMLKNSTNWILYYDSSEKTSTFDIKLDPNRGWQYRSNKSSRTTVCLEKVDQFEDFVWLFWIKFGMEFISFLDKA